MVRSALSKVAWAGRTASMVFGLALVLALLVGVASMALAGTGVGATFNLGKLNQVGQMSQLVGFTNDPMLRIDNNGGGANATALNLRVEPGQPPMTVGSQAKVANLNADKIDGKDASQLGGPGRSDVGNTCDPLSDTNYVTCASVDLTLPSAGRVLLVADGLWNQQTGTASGRCRFGGEGTSNNQVEFGNAPAGSVGLTEVTGSASAGTKTFHIECREFSGNTFSFSDMDISAVYVGDS